MILALLAAAARLAAARAAPLPPRPIATAATATATAASSHSRGGPGMAQVCELLEGSEAIFTNQSSAFFHKKDTKPQACNLEKEL